LISHKATRRHFTKIPEDISFRQETIAWHFKFKGQL
jgi:hypothetical protein